MEKIKLVIWDLDGTFWKGTLSEEGVEVIDKHVELVKELTNRGIINSIVSKNDLEKAKEKLIEFDIWDYFVFPAIEWAPKGALVKSVIEKCQLRDENVLFLDDNHLNLNEAKYYNPNLHTLSPDFIAKISSHEAFVGKDDISHTRLNQYKVLENKTRAKVNFNSNLEFLRSSNIRIEFLHDLAEHKDRILELISRTNQLNFTKIRLNAEEVGNLINNTNFSSVLLKVNDDYGDYDIVGFYALEKTENRLRHFVFSCRILNLGIAQYVYTKLNFPSLEIVPEVSETLDRSRPDWISEVSGSNNNLKSCNRELSERRTRIFFKGGCDLDQMLSYLKWNNFVIEDETNYVTKHNMPIHQEHTQILLDSLGMSAENKKFITENDFISFTDENFYQTRVFDADYDCLIYSLLMDYTQEIYQHKIRGFLLPFGGYSNLWTNCEAHKKIVQSNKSRGITTIDEKTLERFASEFEHLGQITPEKFVDNLKMIRRLIPQEIPIVFINGAELRHSNQLEEGAWIRHRAMNEALDTFIENSVNTFLLDLRTIVTDPTQLTDNIRHYTRITYKEISMALLDLLNSKLDKKINTGISVRAKLRAVIDSSIDTAKSIIKRAIS